MANATARVGKGTVRREDEFFRHSFDTLSSVTTLYTNAMIGMKVNGYLAKLDDTQALTYWGVVRGREGNPILPTNGAASGTAGDGTLDLDVHHPYAFELAITSVAITDIGRVVYALDDQTGTLDPSATTFANPVGVVRDLVYAMNSASPVANVALVQPFVASDYPRGNILQVAAASGAVTLRPGTVVVTKASAAALTIVDPTTGPMDGLEMDFLSVTAAAHTLIAPSGFNASGTTATFAASKGSGLKMMAFAGKWYVKSSVGITLS